MTQTIALTGTTGFVGRHLLSRLLYDGYKIKALVRQPEALKSYEHPNLALIEGDLDSDLADWANGADSIIHLAGLVKAKTWRDYETVNVVGAKNVAIAALKASVPHLILMSSMAARAPQLSAYAKSKYLGEMAVQETYSGNLSIIRAPAVFGPGDKATKPIFDFMAKGLLPSAGGRGWRNRSVAMVYVHDLIEDLATRGLNGDYKGQTVSPATIGAMSMPVFAEFASEALSRPVRAFPMPLIFLYPLAFVTTITLRLFGIGHLSLGKLAEFLYEQWQSNDSVANPTPIARAIGETIDSYQ